MSAPPQTPVDSGLPFRRRRISLKADDLVSFEEASDRGTTVSLAQPASPDVDLTAWISVHRTLLAERLRKSGAILFRGFSRPRTVNEFHAVMSSFSDRLMEYEFGSTPRTEVTTQVYTSTEYPAEQAIPSHNEMSYTHHWPAKIWFFSMIVAEKGGETPLADSRHVYRSIASDVRTEFEKKGVMYVRHYSDKLDVPWQKVFRTTDKTGVEHYCRREGIQFSWQPNGGLRTWQIGPAIVRHPLTQAPLWFNQAHLFHISALPAETQRVLLDLSQEQGLPRNAYFGDGSEISPSSLEHIRSCYAAAEMRFTWQPFDLLLLDNMLISHGRLPFQGSRKVLVGMSDPVKWNGSDSAALLC